MAALKITMFRGTTKNIVVTVKDKKTNEALDFAAGDKVVMTMKRDVKLEAIDLQKVITAFDGNTAVIPLLPEDTEELAAATYKYDIQLIHGDDTVEMLVDPSDFVLNLSVTDGKIESGGV